MKTSSGYECISRNYQIFIFIIISRCLPRGNSKTGSSNSIDSSQFFWSPGLYTIEAPENPRFIEIMNHRSLLLALLVARLSFAAMPAQAQESREEIKSARCSALFTMLAEAFPTDARLPVFRRFIGIFNELYLREKKERTGSSNAEDGEARRAALLKEFRQTYADRQPALKEEVVLCGAWADGYLAQGDNVTHVPVIPKLIPSSVRQEYETLADLGWARWLK